MTRAPADAAVFDLIAQSKREHRARPLFHYMFELCPELAERIGPEAREALAALPVYGGRVADAERTEQLLAARDRYDVLRKTMKRPEAIAILEVEFQQFSIETLWELTRGGIRRIEKLRRERR